MRVKVQLSDILRAQRDLAPGISRTPLWYSQPLSHVSECEAWLKLENYQITGSFKIRGAYTKLRHLSEGGGVITASAGNHGQGVALAAHWLGLSAQVVVPRGTPQIKIDGILQYGAKLLVAGDNYDESEDIAHELAEKAHLTFIHAFEDDEVVAGQATLGLEMLTDQPDLEAILVPAGGGGLIAGIAALSHAINPRILVIGVQSEASPAWVKAWQAKAIVPVPYQDTWAEGLLGKVGRDNFAFVQDLVADFVLVSEEEIKRAILWALHHHHFILEGSGAVALAWLLYHGQPLQHKKVGVVLTGANIDPERLRWLLQP